MSINQAKSSYDKRIPNKLIKAASSFKSFWSLAKTAGNNLTKFSFPPLTKDGTVAASLEVRAELIVTQFSRNSTLYPQRKHPPTVPQVRSSVTEEVFKHRTNGHIRNILKIFSEQCQTLSFK